MVREREKDAERGKHELLAKTTRGEEGKGRGEKKEINVALAIRTRLLSSTATEREGRANQRNGMET